MKATEFIKVLLPVSNAVLTKAFAYSVDENRDFVQIYLTSEPDVKVATLCKENGYIIKERKMWITGTDGMVSIRIWPLSPENAEDYEFIEK